MWSRPGGAAPTERLTATSGKVTLTNALAFPWGLSKELDGFMGGFDTSILTTVLPVAVLASMGAFFTARFRKNSTSRSLAMAWPQTMGTVLSATVQVVQRGSTRQEAPLVLYAYQVDGQVFQGHRVRASTESGRARLVDADSRASNTVARYPSGAPVVVYYDPMNPANSALER